MFRISNTMKFLIFLLAPFSIMGAQQELTMFPMKPGKYKIIINTVRGASKLLVKKFKKADLNYPPYEEAGTGIPIFQEYLSKVLNLKSGEEICCFIKDDHNLIQPQPRVIKSYSFFDLSSLHDPVVPPFQIEKNLDTTKLIYHFKNKSFKIFSSPPDISLQVSWAGDLNNDAKLDFLVMSEEMDFGYVVIRYTLLISTSKSSWLKFGECDYSSE